MKFSLSFRGFSLVEIMVSLGMFSMISLGTVEYLRSNQDTSKRLGQKLESIGLLNEMKILLSRSAICSRNFASSGENLLSSFTVDRLVYTDGTDSDWITSSVPPGTKTYANGELQIKEIEISSAIEPFQSDTNVKVPVNVTFTKLKEKIANKQDVTKTFYIVADIDNTTDKNIIRCQAQGFATGKDPYWEIDAEGDGIYLADPALAVSFGFKDLGNQLSFWNPEGNFSDANIFTGGPNPDSATKLVFYRATGEDFSNPQAICDHCKIWSIRARGYTGKSGSEYQYNGNLEMDARRLGNDRIQSIMRFHPGSNSDPESCLSEDGGLLVFRDMVHTSDCAISSSHLLEIRDPSSSSNIPFTVSRDGVIGIFDPPPNPTGSSARPVHVVTSGRDLAHLVTNNTPDKGGVLIAGRARGTVSSPEKVEQWDRIGAYLFQSYRNSTNTAEASGGVSNMAINNFTTLAPEDFKTELSLITAEDGANYADERVIFRPGQMWIGSFGPSRKHSMSTLEGMFPNRGILNSTASPGELNVFGRIEADVYTQVTSDQRLKASIRPLLGTLDKLYRLNGVSYFWDQRNKEFDFPTDKQYGLLAQDVLPLFPEAITKTFANYYGVRYESFSAILLGSIKELDKKLKVNQIDSKLEKLEAILTEVEDNEE